MKADPLRGLEIEIAGRVFGKHPEDLDSGQERHLIELVAAELIAIESGRRGLM